MAGRGCRSPPISASDGKANAPPPVLFGRRRVRPRLLSPRPRTESPRARGTPGRRAPHGPVDEKVGSPQAVVTTEVPVPRRSARGVCRLAPCDPRWAGIFQTPPLFGLASIHRCRSLPGRPRLAEQSIPAANPMMRAASDTGTARLGPPWAGCEPAPWPPPQPAPVSPAHPGANNAPHLQRAAPAVPAL